jgi:phosphotransferase system enzyme I (PtsI)
LRPGAAERRGTGASPGIAIGPAYVLRRERLVVPEYLVEGEGIEAEVARLEAAFVQVRADLDAIRSGMQSTGLVGDIFDAQFLFLEDATLHDEALRDIRDSGRNAEWALQREAQRLEAMFQSVADPYIRERSSDVSFVLRRVLRVLLGREPEGLENAPPGVIVLAEDLAPGEVAQVTRAEVAGLVTEAGSRTSHVTIMARSLEIPAVVGAGPGLTSGVSDGTLLIVDGRSGRVLVDPDARTVADYERQLTERRVLSAQLLRYADLPAETLDGVEVKLMANVDLRQEIPDALRYGAEGIGLFRTEFLFMNRADLPSEEEQEAAYREILEAVAPRSAIIRTLDLGGDKVPAGLGISGEANPALGLRGVRLSFQRPELFRAQLRALLRASRYGSLRVLLPMVSNLGELEFSREQLEKAREEVRHEGVEPGEIEVGAMIETPAAAMIVDLIASRGDFLSIGTNDLLARRSGIVVGMCGEMAGDPAYAWILLALGVGELSMAPFAIPLLKKIVRESTLAEARDLLAEVLGLGTAAEIRERVAKVMAGRFPVEFERLAPSG